MWAHCELANQRGCIVKLLAQAVSLDDNVVSRCSHIVELSDLLVEGACRDTGTGRGEQGQREGQDRRSGEGSIGETGS